MMEYIRNVHVLNNRNDLEITEMPLDIPEYLSMKRVVFPSGRVRVALERPDHLLRWGTEESVAAYLTICFK